MKLSYVDYPLPYTTQAQIVGHSPRHVQSELYDPVNTAPYYPRYYGYLQGYSHRENACHNVRQHTHVDHPAYHAAGKHRYQLVYAIVNQSRMLFAQNNLYFSNESCPRSRSERYSFLQRKQLLVKENVIRMSSHNTVAPYLLGPKGNKKYTREEYELRNPRTQCAW